MGTLSFCLYLCLKCQHVLTGYYSDINRSMSIRRTQGFAILIVLNTGKKNNGFLFLDI